MYTGLIVFIVLIVLGLATAGWLLRRMNRAEAARYARIK